MRDDWDGRYKDLVTAVLEGTGEVLRGVESGATTQRMDVLYRPDAAHRALRLQRGLLGRLTDVGVCNLEPFRNTPSVVHVRDGVRRMWNHHHTSTAEDDAAAAVMTRVVVLSPGRPREAMSAFGLSPHATLPYGVYDTHVAIGLWIVVIAELPLTRDTLALRLMGRGLVLEQALRELMALPAEAWEHKLKRILLRWRQEVATLQSRSEDDEEFMEITHETFEQYEQRVHNDGRQEGMLPLLRLFARRLGRALTSAEQAAVLGRFDTVGPDRLADVVLDLTPDALEAWLADSNAQ